MRGQFVSKKAKEESTAGIEDFGDDDNDPFNLLMEDHEVEKEQKKENKKSQEESLVAGGELLWGKAAQQILSQTTVAVGSAEPSLVTFQASPTSSVSDLEASAECSSSGSKKWQWTSKISVGVKNI